MVTGYQVRLRTVLLGLLATVAAVAAFGLVDLARPEGERAHLGRLFERVGDEGLEPLLSIMERKALANLGVTTSSFWVAVIPVAVAFLVFLARYPTRPLGELYARIPPLRAGVWAAIVAAILGSAVNDSGAIVGGVTLFVLVLGLGWLALDAMPATAGGEADDRAGGAGGRDPGPRSARGGHQRVRGRGDGARAVARGRGSRAVVTDSAVGTRRPDRRPPTAPRARHGSSSRSCSRCSWSRASSGSTPGRSPGGGCSASAATPIRPGG